MMINRNIIFRTGLRRWTQKGTLSAHWGITNVTGRSDVTTIARVAVAVAILAAIRADRRLSAEFKGGLRDDDDARAIQMARRP